jgi:hypothetical protein
MKDKFLFIDFSMLGYHPESCIVLDCSVAVVDTKTMVSSTPYTTKSAYSKIRRFKFSIADQKARGRVALSDGVEFWTSQPKAIIERTLKPHSKDLTVDEFTKEFVNYLAPYGKIDLWWSWNSMDDAAILWRLFCESTKEGVIREHLPRHKSRDMSTFIDSKFEFNLPKLDMAPINDEEYWKSIHVKADSSIDVMANILRMQAIMRAELDMENVDR